ncbi:hypothetical protein HYDPIDRAFT_115316 [Hydnomerulius pinastri MD-312]|uniref:Large ribosomal subunit protein mL59 domain-containing protein n=1 Tax=Hydnomerulius pinastri MD-312 TaxID=994086 RepID=A0A0C9WCR3_9AGAM|nr:hypothetical protein HYDPIDRAFT_115316 [Hydnomerulius pinastri MD-312]
MASAIRRFRLRELAKRPPPILNLVPKPTPNGGVFNLNNFNFSQPAPVVPSPPPSTSKSELPKRANPFIATRNSETGRWAPAKYSLRQQAELIKKARATGTLSLLPPSPKTSAAHLLSLARAKAAPISKRPKALQESKSSEEPWAKPVEWVGEVKEKKVPGADIGNRLYAGKKRMFKGHKWERVAEKKAIRRGMLMRDMAKRVERFKQHHKRRRPNPLKPAKKAGGKLPF